ncbi:MAG: ribonuclease HII [Alphaproteobacteria bacterium]|nr:ribonuclease HII [Alphaproteobacteria bacterium]
MTQRTSLLKKQRKTNRTPLPTFDLERVSGHHIIVGIDEAGCGPWAGPVVVAAVMFPRDIWEEAQKLGLNDSKKLNTNKRNTLFDLICGLADYGIAEASVSEIDTYNIVEAVALATRRVLAQLKHTPDLCLIDGIRNPKLTVPTQMIIKGDQKSCSIAAASILAKVTRDRLMASLANEHPGYGFETNAGYGTKLHQEGLRLYGVTAHHRKTYAPIQKILEG